MKLTNLKSSTSPARLVEANYRWYIELYCPKRLRPTFNLNRILNLAERRQRGYHLCELLNWWMTAGLSIDRFTEGDARRRMLEAQKTSIAPRGHTSVQKAFYHALEIKKAKTRGTSSDSYKSHCGLFISYMENNNIELLPIDELQRHHIIAFLDHRKMVDKVSNTTINNNLIGVSTLLNELLDRGFILDNPCDKIKKLIPEPKKRRPFTLMEATDFMAYTYEHDPLLLLAILFQYCCFMRPIEIRKLQFRDIDLDNNIVYVRSENSKTGRKTGERTPTIPSEFKPYFVNLLERGHPKNFIFGKGFITNQPEHCNKNRLYRRHKRIIKILHTKKVIENTDGLVFYSWKDTGMTATLEYMNVIGVRNQAGHSTTEMTLKYYQAPKINPHMLDMKNNVLPPLNQPLK